MIQTQILEALEENLGSDVDPTEWNWQAMANAVNTPLGPEDSPTASSRRSAATTWPST